MALPNPELVAKHVITLMGGNDNARQTFEADFKEVTDRWQQDTATIGRILRAHLFVEHFLSEYLQSRNPELGSLEDARVTFAQKLSLVGKGSLGVDYLLPGVRKLNAIRNRLAHSLLAEVTKEDADSLLQIDLFRAMRDEESRRESRKPSLDPIDVLEDFAMHAGLALHARATRNSEVWAEALDLAQAESTGTQTT